MKKKGKLSRRFSFAIEEKDYRQLLDLFETSTNSNFSQFLRKLLLQRPITVFYRNRSLDDFTEQCANLTRHIASLLEDGKLSMEEKQVLTGKMTAIHLLIEKIYDHARLCQTCQKPSAAITLS